MLRLDIFAEDLQEGYIFVFNDLVLITKKKKNGKFDLKAKVDVNEARIVNIADTESMLFSISIWPLQR